jgi:hypothetical protein
MQINKIGGTSLNAHNTRGKKGSSSGSNRSNNKRSNNNHSRSNRSNDSITPSEKKNETKT